MIITNYHAKQGYYDVENICQKVTILHRQHNITKNVKISTVIPR